jgi:tripartite-type tricarboxylate transporter receptor subunit TctC
VLAHWGTSRLETMPEVPSLKQAGYDAEYAQWSGLFVPAGTPEAIVQRLRAAARAAANDPKVKEVIMSAGSPVLYQDTPEFERYVQNDVKRMQDVVKKIGKVE